MNKCAKVYHLKCLEKKFPIKLIASNQEFKCPLHFCLTCYGQHQDDNVFRYINKKTFTCIRCPTAYHQLNSCLAAGSVSVDSRHIICPDHAQPSSKRRHVNVSWCFSCNMGGNLVCCELCPTAFHADCLEYKLPEGKFYCSSCFKRHQLLYGDVVWVKLGSYRWWPGMIQHPNDVPINIRNMKHDVGDFPVFFLAPMTTIGSIWVVPFCTWKAMKSEAFHVAARWIKPSNWRWKRRSLSFNVGKRIKKRTSVAKPSNHPHIIT